MTAGPTWVTLGRMTTHLATPRVADALTVGDAAAAVGVTVRTLHHWDDVGLARPSERSAAGYRLYSPADVARLRRVVAYRALDVGLEDIPELLDAPGDDAVGALRRHRSLLGERIARMERTAEALDRLVAARERGLLLTATEQVALFGDGWDPTWADSARSRWGDTAQWAQFAERSAERAPEDWASIAAEVRALEADLAAACRDDVAPRSAPARALAERHRASIGTYFDCPPARHVCLGRLYVADDGFRTHLEALAPGLSRWLLAAIEENARAQGVDPDTATWD